MSGGCRNRRASLSLAAIASLVQRPEFSTPCLPSTPGAFAAYYRTANTIPSGASGEREVNGKRVHLFNVEGTLAVYRVLNIGRLKRLKRWPIEME